MELLGEPIGKLPGVVFVEEEEEAIGFPNIPIGDGLFVEGVVPPDRFDPSVDRRGDVDGKGRERGEVEGMEPPNAAEEGPMKPE